MTQDLSANTQAILLLTAPLNFGRGFSTTEALTPREYAKLATHLHVHGRQPGEMLASDAPGVVLDGLDATIDASRLRRLLDRGFLLAQAVERWHTRSIWVISRADDSYPRRIKERLRDAAPPILYGCGDALLLDRGGLAVVGSRQIDSSLMEYAEDVGRLAGRARQGVISGGAKGVDQAAMRGALDVGGTVVGVLADSLEKVAIHRELRSGLVDHQLVLVSPYDPNAGFNVGNAMQRNKLIYALADAALVVNSDLKKGGTWAGAEEQLRKFHFVAMYVRSTGTASAGLEALRSKGARDWPNPSEPATLAAILNRDTEAILVEPLSHLGGNVPSDGDLTPHVRERVFGLIEQSKKPKKPMEIAAELGVSFEQVTQGLNELVAEGRIEKPASRAAFRLRPPTLFDGIST